MIRKMIAEGLGVLIHVPFGCGTAVLMVAGVVAGLCRPRHRADAGRDPPRRRHRDRRIGQPGPLAGILHAAGVARGD
ncbi:MAG: hypothetical protein ACK4OP_16900 [Gemmobacter sp.]